MSIGFPIYLTRILSSMLCGLIIVALVTAELYWLNHGWLICNFPRVFGLNSNVPFFVSVVLFSGLFFVGELFTGLAEMLVFDKIFLNVRFTKDTTGILENVSGSFCREAKQNSKQIKFGEMVDFSENNPSAFALSEMYFNIHRILGGIFILFLIAPFIIFVLVLCGFTLTISCVNILVFLGVNLGLAYFSFIQARRQRLFANSLLFYGRRIKNTKHSLYKRSY